MDQGGIELHASAFKKFVHFFRNSFFPMTKCWAQKKPSRVQQDWGIKESNILPNEGNHVLHIPSSIFNCLHPPCYYVLFPCSWLGCLLILWCSIFVIVAIPAGEASALLSVHDIATDRNAMASNRLLDTQADLELDIFQTIIHIYLLQNTLSCISPLP